MSSLAPAGLQARVEWLEAKNAELEATVAKQNEFIRQLTDRVAICSELLAKRALKCERTTTTERA